MNNQEKARSIIECTVLGKQITAPSTALAITQALADEGLLMPELPEPDKDRATFVPDGKEWLPCGPDGPSVWTVPGGRVMVQRIEPGDLTPEEARQLALAMLAAANHAESEA